MSPYYFGLLIFYAASIIIMATDPGSFIKMNGLDEDTDYGLLAAQVMNELDSY